MAAISTRRTQVRWRGDGKEIFYVEGDTLFAVPVTTRAGPCRRGGYWDIDCDIGCHNALTVSLRGSLQLVDDAQRAIRAHAGGAVVDPGLNQRVSRRDDRALGVGRLDAPRHPGLEPLSAWASSCSASRSRSPAIATCCRAEARSSTDCRASVSTWLPRSRSRICWTAAAGSLPPGLPAEAVEDRDRQLELHV